MALLLLPVSLFTVEIPAPETGWVGRIDYAVSALRLSELLVSNVGHVGTARYQFCPGVHACARSACMTRLPAEHMHPNHLGKTMDAMMGFVES